MAPIRILHVHVDEQIIDGQRLGRYVHHDERSRDYVAPMAQTITDVNHAAKNLPLNQGDLGSCTGNALVGALNSQPDLPEGHKARGEKDAKEVYGVETKLEGQPWPPNDPGGSGLEVCKAAQQLGWLPKGGGYRHAFGTEQLLQALTLRPVIIGIAWMTSFDQPDPQTGVIGWADGATIRGGHEVVLDEINSTMGPEPVVGAWNSWGKGWGLHGRFYIPVRTVLDRLLHYAEFPGDCTVPLPGAAA